MATVSTCDRCRRVLTNLTRWMKLKPAVVWTDGASMAKESDIDLCGECYEWLMAGFKSFAENTERKP